MAHIVSLLFRIYWINLMDYEQVLGDRIGGSHPTARGMRNPGSGRTSAAPMEGAIHE